jgi:hypothetical protein
MKCPHTGQILQEIVETETEPYMIVGKRKEGKAQKTEKIMQSIEYQTKRNIQMNVKVTPVKPVYQYCCSYPKCKTIRRSYVELTDNIFCDDHTTLMHAQQAIFKIWEKSYGGKMKWPNVQAKQKAFLDFYSTRILSLENYDVKV